jgi:hypothetical protein
MCSIDTLVNMHQKADLHEKRAVEAWLSNLLERWLTAIDFRSIGRK